MRSLYDTNRSPGLDERVARVAATQHGVFSRAQALACGATDAEIRTRLRTRLWESLRRSLYRLPGVPRTRRQAAMAATLALDAPLSLHAAAGLVGLMTGRSRLEVSMTSKERRTRFRNVKVHLLTEPIPDEDITTIDGIPVTKPARTLLDLAAELPESLFERCLDDALRRRLVSIPFLLRWLDDPRRKRHRGHSVLAGLVDARGTVGVTESPLETDLLRALRLAGVPAPRLQYEIRDGDRFVARVDFAYPERRVAVEADGFRFHDTRSTFDDERARANALSALGWRVLRVTSQHLQDGPAEVVAWIRDALAAGG